MAELNYTKGKRLSTGQREWIINQMQDDALLIASILCHHTPKWRKIIVDKATEIAESLEPIFGIKS